MFLLILYISYLTPFLFVLFWSFITTFPNKEVPWQKKNEETVSSSLSLSFSMKQECSAPEGDAPRPYLVVIRTFSSNNTFLRNVGSHKIHMAPHPEDGILYLSCRFLGSRHSQFIPSPAMHSTELRIFYSGAFHEVISLVNCLKADSSRTGDFYNYSVMPAIQRWLNKHQNLIRQYK
jgi:hypothetical protein